MSDKLLKQLLSDGIVLNESARLEPLPGGVSSDIYLVHDGDRKFVVKQALGKLKVEADWFADVSRNETEINYIEYVAKTNPSSVPEIIGSGDGYFAMEYLGDGFTSWKAAMLCGQFSSDWARMAGAFLGDVHKHSRNNDKLAEQFNKMDSFWQLRIEPYLIATGENHAELNSMFLEEAERLRHEASALVHGDFSPKNILISSDRLVVLDCEVACYADPAFDVAFLISHLFLKILYHRNYYSDLQSMITAFCHAYGMRSFEFESRVVRLVLMLLLGRVDGKSPVEYLTDKASRQFLRSFVRLELIQNPRGLDKMLEVWVNGIKVLHD